jgi:hypothetical protein
MTTIEDTLKLIYKQMVGLNNVDNTSDLNKPISNTIQTGLNSKLNLAGGTLTGGLTGTVATFSGDVISNGISISSLNSGKLNLAGGTLTGGLTGTTATFTGDVVANNISISSLNSGKLNLAGGTLTGGLTGTTATFTGDLVANGISITSLNSGKLNTSGGTLTGGLTGTVATFSGDVIANSISITALNSGKLNTSGGTLTGGLTGTTATFTGDVIGNGISVTALNSGKLSLSGGTLTGGLTGTVATFSGDVIGNGVSITSLNTGKLSLSGGTLSGGLTGTLATFSGDVIGNGVSITSLNTGKLSLSGGTLSGGLTGTVATFSGNVTASGGSITSLNTRVTALESTAGGSSTGALSTYTTEIDAFYDGVNQGSQYIKNSIVYVVENKYRTVYKMSRIKTSTNVNITNPALYNSSPSAAYTALTGSNQWTVEAYIYPIQTGDTQYILDPRISDLSNNNGLVFCMTGTPLRPATFCFGDTSRTGSGSNLNVVNGDSNIILALYTWSHVAWVKYSSNDTSLTVFVNGLNAGTIVCGTNASTTSEWAKVTIGTRFNGQDDNICFRGRLGGLKVSNVALYTTAFAPPQTLTKYSKTSLVTGTNNTVFLLGPNFKDYISNVTLTATTATGTIENYNEMIDISLNSYIPFSQLYLTAPLQNNICGIYTAASIISTSTWQCHYGIGPDITIGSKWQNNYTNLICTGQTTTGILSTSAANYADVKAVVMVLSYGNDITRTLWSNANHPLICNSNIYVCIRSNLTIATDGLPTTTELYFDNVLLKNQTTNNYAPASFYCGTKWSVIILNTSFSSNSWEFLGNSTYLNNHAFTGTKLGCIIYYNTVLTSTNIADITKWGLERFGSF